MPTDLAGHPGEAIARVEARQVRRLTGEFASDFWRRQPFPPEPQVPSQELKDWRSNTMAVVEDPSEFPVAGFNGAWMIGDADGHAKALLPRTDNGGWD